MFDALVTFMTLIALGFVAVWWHSQGIRDCVEAPKYRLLGQYCAPSAKAFASKKDRRKS